MKASGSYPPEQGTGGSSASVERSHENLAESGTLAWHGSNLGERRLLGEALAAGVCTRPRQPKQQPSLRAQSKDRPQSEPPQHGSFDKYTSSAHEASQSGQRLPQLIDEIEGHLLQQTARPPADASGWLQETVRLEHYMQEMQQLLTQHLDVAQEIVPRQDSKGRGSGRGMASGRSRTRVAHGKVPIRELSVLRGDKDLRWARQQLKNCEREHSHLQHLLGDEDAERSLFAELRQVESALELEKRRLKNLQRESHKRERSMARAAERAGGGELGSLNADGNARASKEVERLEAELEVWQMKNSSLAKQIDESTARLQEALQNREKMTSRRQHLHARLDSEDAKKQAAQDQHRQECQIEEERQLRSEIQSLLEQRRSTARSTESTLKERARHLEDLRKQQAEKERLVAQFKITEQQLRRQIRLEHRRPGSARSEHRGPLRVPPSPKMAPERGRLNAGDAPQPAAAASPQPDEVGEGATRPTALSKSLQTRPQDRSLCPMRAASSPS
ncbi:unnamed protein product [Symbiodinium pilosum]|uniref:Uncharacterized protein n=1 Tax=Symbiodinium pilosum TaxID=2952 RepID=A0A812U5G7_SYMPI|nr:unnamed protein product [Symbiodinium pilosum]